jgi:hypothetical protein
MKNPTPPLDGAALQLELVRLRVSDHVHCASVLLYDTLSGISDEPSHEVFGDFDHASESRGTSERSEVPAVKLTYFVEARFRDGTLARSCTRSTQALRPPKSRGGGNCV